MEPRYRGGFNELVQGVETPLGDRDVYEAVFWREKATGVYIVKVGEERERQEGELFVENGNDDSDDLGRDNINLLDSESDSDTKELVPTSTESTEPTKPSTPILNSQLTATQKHRINIDPDRTLTPRKSLLYTNVLIWNRLDCEMKEVFMEE
ncbi:hypothetical protein QBC46DRAFT_452224 [Diplogelasinospora grovesii]|uniref:Uncharacterized protein n=1 Tax=Diplogelasinospora grovesii TaxID=303347 RepID=A0AAN6S219_9PEZI|nr:hypothetical protein QBC46DRAFT_452224 [Diplogelasinospora grovesii]